MICILLQAYILLTRTSSEVNLQIHIWNEDSILLVTSKGRSHYLFIYLTNKAFDLRVSSNLLCTRTLACMCKIYKGTYQVIINNIMHVQTFFSYLQSNVHIYSIGMFIYAGMYNYRPVNIPEVEFLSSPKHRKTTLHQMVNLA